MKIGFFGDSYVDLDCAVWANQIVQEIGTKGLSTGLGGSSQYHAIKTWETEQQKGIHYDVAIFTLTWYHRLYRVIGEMHNVMRAEAEARLDSNDPLAQAIAMYRKYVYDDSVALFSYELMVRYTMELAEAYPNTKFIFIPNTEIARPMARKYFKKGVLLDFAFESVSNQEPNSPGPIGKVWDGNRPGHLNSFNHTVTKNLVKDIIINYNDYADTIVDVDLKQFDIIKENI